MSLDSSSTEAELYFFDFPGVYCSIAAVVLIAYDVVLTFNREVACIWRRKFSAVTVLFLVMRYVTLSSQVLTFVNEFQPGLVLPCEAIGYLSNSLSIVVRATSAVFGALRIWAIWGQHWLVLVTILPISLVPAVMDIYQNTLIRLSPLTSPLPFPVGGCSWFIPLPIDAQTRFATATRACAIAADAAILAATWMKTWSIHRGLKSANITVDVGRSRISLPELLIRDGTLYFGALFCLNVIDLALDVTPEVHPP